MYIYIFFLVSFVKIIRILDVKNFGRFSLKAVFCGLCFYPVSQLGLGLKLAHEVNENSGIQETKVNLASVYSHV